MKKENAINFLLYSYFGVTLESGENEIIEAAINRAYRDASSHVLSIEDHVKDEVKGEGIKKIRDMIKKDLEKDSQEFDNKHNECCNALVNKYREFEEKEESFYKKDEDEETDGDEKKRKFSYGIAQKWINMTMKYLCVIKSVFAVYGKNAELDFLDGLEKDLHIPIDGYILEAAVSKEIKYKDMTYGHGLGISIPSINDKVLPWSKWEEKDYTEFANELRKKVKVNDNESRLDWEGPAWIAVAKKRKGSEEISYKASKVNGDKVAENESDQF